MARIKNLFAACCAIVVLALSGQSAWPQSGRTIQLIVPVPPGASTDAVARLMAEQIGRAQGVTIVVENRPGASGMIGTEAVSRAAPDGNTLLMTANTYLIDAQTRKANYHPVTAFDPICYLVQSPAVFVVNSASPYKTLKDLLDAARAKPGELSMAAVGPGSTFQMGFTTIHARGQRHDDLRSLHRQRAGRDGGDGAARDLGVCRLCGRFGERQGGQASRAGRRHDEADRATAGCADLRRIRIQEPGSRQLVRHRRAGATRRRKSLSLRFAGWLKAALQDPEVKAKLALQGLYPVGMCGDEFAAYVRKRFDDYGEMIRESNIKAQ